MLESLIADIRFALRWLIKSPGFTTVAVASLAIGIGFNTALYAVVDALLFRPLPVASADRLVDVYTSRVGATAADRFGTSSYVDFLDLRSQNTVFDELVGYTPMFGPLNLGDRSRLTLGEIVTGNYFSALGIGAAAGRTLLPEDDAPSAPRVAMVSYRYWTRELGRAPDVVGRTLKLRGTVHTIVGVAPRGFNGMTSILSPDLWVPMSAALDIEPVGMHDGIPSPTGTTRLDRRGDRWLFARGLRKRGVSVGQASANLNAIMKALAEANPATNRDRYITAVATRSVYFHPAADSTVLPIALGLMATVGLVLLVACANVASMLLARATGRQREIGIRLAIGASRGRLIRQLVTETLVMSVFGAVAGVALAWTITRVLGAVTLPIPIPLAFDLRIDGRVLLFTMLVALLAVALAGLAPAAKASRVNLTGELRGESPVTRVGRRWSLRDYLVAGQITLTAALLVVAALLTRSLAASERADVGFDVHHLALVSTDTAMLRYSDEQSARFYERALERIRAIAGVESGALATRVPFSVNYNRWTLWVPGYHTAEQSGDTVEVTRVSPEYFQTLGVPLLQGRNFNGADRPQTPRIAIVNETMARRYWPGESAIGKVVRSRGPSGAPIEIVGIAGDHRVSTVGEPATSFMMLPRSQAPNPYSAIIARTRGDADALLRDMRRTLLALEPNLVFVENQTMNAEVAATLFPVRAGAWAVTTVGVMAMLLAAIGLYGVIAYSVSRRTREIGIRMALGAHPASVAGMIMRQGLVVAAAGLAAGCLLAVAAARLVAGALYGIGAADPVSWIGAAATVLIVSALANFVPARRAARVEPSVALRVE